MEYFTNHCWCSDSIWGGVYDCRYILTIDKEVDPEFDELIEETKFFSQEEFDMLEDIYKNAEQYKDLIVSKDMCMRNTFRLNEEVKTWLHFNVEDRKGYDINKGWAIGSDEYNRVAYPQGTFSIFFHRKKDLMNFVRYYSKYKKPTKYVDYFKDERKTLDITTLTYEV